MSNSIESRVLKLEFSAGRQFEELQDLERRVTATEDDHSEQLRILDKMGQTVETQSKTVATLSHLFQGLDKDHEVFKARINVIIAILTAIGVAVIGGIVKLLFFSSLS